MKCKMGMYNRSDLKLYKTALTAPYTFSFGHNHRCLSHGLGFNEMVCHWVSHRVGQGATGQDVLASKEM